MRLRLQKRYRKPCVTCGAEPKGARRYHPACLPVDLNKAMGFDPNAVSAGTYVPPPSTAAPPPPVPKTTVDLKVESILVFEAALVSGIRDGSIVRSPELEKAIGTINSLKQRVVRPGTEGEGVAATNVVLKKLIDLVFGTR